MGLAWLSRCSRLALAYRVKSMATLDEMLGLDAASPDMTRAEFLVESDRVLLRRLIEVRAERGLTQDQVGELMGVSQPTVAAFEAHDSNPRLSTIRRYAQAVRALVHHKVEPDEGQLLNGAWHPMWASDHPLHVAPAAAPAAAAKMVINVAGDVVSPFPDAVDNSRADFALAA